MAVDNFDLIRKHLSFVNERSFYFIQIMKRKKENPEMTVDSQVIDSFYIFDLDKFDRVKPHIIDICERSKARAYIKMNCLDMKSVTCRMAKDLLEVIDSENWRKSLSSLNSACGQCGVQKGAFKLYLLDFDDVYVGTPDASQVKDYLNNVLLPVHEGEEKVIMEVPTRNGCHFIITGYNKQMFAKDYPGIQTHDDASTILYFPNSCN